MSNEIYGIKKECHKILDSYWKQYDNEKTQHIARGILYTMLAKELRIDASECHFKKMNLRQTKQSIAILRRWRRKKVFDKVLANIKK